MSMEDANVRVVLNKFGSDVPMTDVTPAEAILLHTLHGPHNGGRTFGDEFRNIKVVGVAKISSGKTESKQVAPAIAEQSHEEVVTLAAGIVGQQGYKPAVTKKVIDREEVPAVFADFPVLVDRTPAQELARLRAKYAQAKNSKGELIVGTLWADRMNPKMPEKFSDINWAEIGELSSAPELQAASINYVTGSLVRTA